MTKLIGFFKENPPVKAVYLGKSPQWMAEFSKKEFLRFRSDEKKRLLNCEAIVESLKHLKKAIDELTVLDIPSDEARYLAGELNKLYIGFKYPASDMTVNNINIDLEVDRLGVKADELSEKYGKDVLNAIIYTWYCLYGKALNDDPDNVFYTLADIFTSDCLCVI